MVALDEGAGDLNLRPDMVPCLVQVISKGSGWTSKVHMPRALVALLVSLCKSVSTILLELGRILAWCVLMLWRRPLGASFLQDQWCHPHFVHVVSANQPFCPACCLQVVDKSMEMETPYCPS